MEPIFHVAELAEWNDRTDHYQARSLDTEGFIHCSTPAQLGGVLERHFPERDDVVILEIDPKTLGSSVVYEDLYELGEDYPHIYGVIPLDAIVRTHERGQTQ